jgi:hypothetical protein
MKLCGFEVGLDQPLFLIAGNVAARSRCPAVRPGATAEAFVGAGGDAL